MIYLNPFYLFDLPTGEMPTAEAMRKLRRKLMTEYELEGEVVLEWKGVKLDRSGVLTQLAELEDPTRGEYHQRVAQNPEMLQFLIGGTTEEFPATPSSTDQGFQTFLVPYIGTAWANWILAVLKGGNGDKMQWGLHRVSELVGKAREDALKPSLIWLLARAERMDAWERTQTNAASDAADLLELPPSQMYFLAELPRHHLYLRDRFASSYVTLLIQTARNGFQSYNDLKKKLDAMIIGLRLPTELQPDLRLRVEAAFSMFAALDQAQATLNRMKDIRSVPPPHSKPSRGWFVLVLIIFIAIFIGVLNRKKSSSKLPYIPPFEYKLPDPVISPPSYNFDYNEFSRQLDSLMKNLDSTIHAIKMPEFEDVVSADPSEIEEEGLIEDFHLPNIDSMPGGSDAERRNAMWDSILKLGKERGAGKHVPR